jgi:hypothetical protein
MTAVKTPPYSDPRRMHDMQIRKTIGVRLYEDELAALRTAAEREDRDVRRQSARFIRSALIQAGDLNTAPAEPATAR